jgi:hypothetical protein
MNKKNSKNLNKRKLSIQDDEEEEEEDDENVYEDDGFIVQDAEAEVDDDDGSEESFEEDDDGELDNDDLSLIGRNKEKAKTGKLKKGGKKVKGKNININNFLHRIRRCF